MDKALKHDIYAKGAFVNMVKSGEVHLTPQMTYD